MSFYSNLQSIATRLLTDKGQSLTFTRVVHNAYTPGSALGTASTTTFSGYGVAFNYSDERVDGTLIQRGDVRLLLQNTTTEPAEGDEVSLDSVDYRVIRVIKQKPAGTNLYYECQLRL